mgnify:CR=1 FL=1
MLRIKQSTTQGPIPMIRNWVYYMRRGLEAMFPKTSSSKCTSDETCWCMEEEFPPIPDSYDTDECLTPEQLEQLRLEEALVESYTDRADHLDKHPPDWDKYGEAMRGEK